MRKSFFRKLVILLVILANSIICKADPVDTLSVPIVLPSEDDDLPIIIRDPYQRNLYGVFDTDMGTYDGNHQTLNYNFDHNVQILCPHPLVND